MAPPKNRNDAPATLAAAAVVSATADGMRQMLQVSAKRDGFRRAGRPWSASTTVPIDELTVQQYAQLTTEPMLVTLRLEVPAESVGEAGQTSAAGGA